jgi:F0F1-type ATP synthase assembly protein I
MEPSARRSFQPAGAGGVLVGTIMACAAIGALVGWAAGSAGVGALVGAAVGIPLGVFAVYRRYRGFFA